MSKQASRKVAPTISSERLAEQAAEALRLEKFKDAIEFFKQLVKQDPRPHWSESLAGAYIGRARALAAKGMFKEAEIVLGNAARADGSSREPLLLLRCLVRQGQFQKALDYSIRHMPESGGDAERAELTAALFLAFPVEVRGPHDARSPRAIWLRAAGAAKAALECWTGAQPEAEVDAALAQIPLNSPFRAVRLILKSLLLASGDSVKARRLLDGVAEESPFAPLRRAAASTIASASEEPFGGSSLPDAAVRRFVVEASGLSASAGQTAIRLAEAEAAGPGALFSFLVKQAEQFDAADLRSACRNLLPRAPDCMQQFEKRFGPLEGWEKQRILALAAEGAGRWGEAEHRWRAVAKQFEDDGPAGARLSAGVVYRHLAALARKHEAIRGDGFFEDPRPCYLRKSVAADPDYLPARLELIDLLRESEDPEEQKEWHAQADAAAAAFPQESSALLRAIDSAVERKAFKKAAGYAQKLLALDPINLPARQRMIDLQIALARKQLRAKRPDLAAKALDEAVRWERSDKPSAALRLNRGLLGLYGDQGAEAEASLRRAVEFAGGGAIGWFRAVIEEALLAPPGRAHVPLLRDELAELLKRAPEKREIVAIAAALGANEVKQAAKATREVGLKFCSWLRKAKQVQFSTDEFHPVAEALLRAQLFDVLGDFAAESRRREPCEPVWRFYQIVARTKNNPDLLGYKESDEIAAMGDVARAREEFAWFRRIRRYLDSSGDDPAAKRRAKRLAAREEDFVSPELEAVLEGMFDAISQEEVRRLIKSHGPDGAPRHIAAQLAKAPALRHAPLQALEGLATVLIQIVQDAASPF
jgi:cellulose synthase operon protein C